MLHVCTQNWGILCVKLFSCGQLVDGFLGTLPIGPAMVCAILVSVNTDNTVEKKIINLSISLVTVYLSYGVKTVQTCFKGLVWKICPSFYLKIFRTIIYIIKKMSENTNEGNHRDVNKIELINTDLICVFTITLVSKSGTRDSCPPFYLWRYHF